MRQSIGGAWLLQLMLLFILLFVAFIILTLNYSKTIKVKNEIVSMIEKYEGLNDQSLELVNNYLVAAGYSTTGVCVTENNTTSVYGASDLFDASLELAQPGERYYYCIKKYNGTNLTNYYQVGVFYRFNLPVIGDTANFNVKGTTSNFFAKDDPDYCYTIDGSCVSNPGTNSGTPIQPITYYTVTFNSDGGSSVGTQKIRSGEKASQPKNPTKEGYEFEEWQLDGKPFDFYTRIYSDITLVAKWRSLGSNLSQTTVSDSNQNNTHTPSSVTNMVEWFINRWEKGEDIDSLIAFYNIFNFPNPTEQEIEKGVYRVLTLTNDSDDYCKLYQKLYSDKYNEMYGTDEEDARFNCGQEAFRWWGSNLNHRFYRYAR